jgi:hypothetical protein
MGESDTLGIDTCLEGHQGSEQVHVTAYTHHQQEYQRFLPVQQRIILNAARSWDEDSTESTEARARKPCIATVKVLSAAYAQSNGRANG